MIFRTLTSAAGLAAMLTVAACDAPQAENKTIQGTVAYRERMALPPDAQVKVSLVDVSKADAPSVTIAESIITPKGQVPVPYVLEYDPAKLESGHSYALQARITSGEDLLFITTTHNPYVIDGQNSTDLMLQRTGN